MLGGWAVPTSPSLRVPVLLACTQPQTHVGEEQGFWLSACVCQFLPWKEQPFGSTWGKVSREAAPAGLDNLTVRSSSCSVGLSPALHGMPPRCLPHSLLPEAGW